MRNGTSVVAEVTVALQEVGPQLLEEFLARSEMKSDMHRIELQLMKQFDINTILDIPKVLKRIANDTKNMKQIGRQLAKVAHANPGVTFDRLLYHAESYENFISPVVQSLAFMTPLALDVLSFMIIDHLNNPSKKKGDKAHDGFDAQWFKNLAMFCGVLARKCGGR